MTGHDIHLAPKKEQIRTASAHGVEFALVKAQWGKEDSVLSIHADPRSWTTARFQTTDFLGLLGFTRNHGCHIFRRCYLLAVANGFDFDRFTSAFESAYCQIREAERSLERCGLMLPTPEAVSVGLSGNGHNVSNTIAIEQSEDEECEYRLTFVKDAIDKGFVIHYRAKVEKLIPEYHSVYRLLGFRHYDSCPEFGFEPCFYRTIRTGASTSFDIDFSSNQIVKSAFEAHTTCFAGAVKLLSSANESLRELGISFLPLMHTTEESIGGHEKSRDQLVSESEPSSRGPNWKYDVALSFAGSERKYASELCNILTKNGVKVFLDEKFASELWGQDLAAEFDRIFSNEARFCVVFVSEQYRDRMWTRHEFKSILGRTVSNRGQSYLLPIKIDNTNLDGLQFTVGYVHIRKGIEYISNLLIERIKADKQK